ncbi:WhiB family transcriptional regulator [Mycobacterium kansasii]
MNHKTQLRPPSTLCLQRPGDWSSPQGRTLARHQCLNCPTLRSCAEAALRHRPSYGMWAGVWINGDFADKQRQLELTATAITPTKPPKPHPISTPPPPAPPPHATQRAPRPGRVGKLCTTVPPAPVAALIAARASGHCEIMAPACTYQQSAIFSRRRGGARTTLTSPADAICACRNCIDLIEHTDTPTALDLGYIVDRRRRTSTTAMLWRQRHWVYLDTQGRLQPATGPELAHSA